MDGLAGGADDVADRSRFSGVVRVDLDGTVALAKAYGLARRDLGVPTPSTLNSALRVGRRDSRAWPWPI